MSDNSAEIRMTHVGLLGLCARLRQRLKEEADNEHEGANERLRNALDRPAAVFDEGVKKGAYWISKHIGEVDLAAWLAVALQETTHVINSPGPPIPLILTCPICGERHVDKGEFATKPHHTHSCQHCGLTWRPAIVPTVGVQYLPGFKDDER